MSSANEVSVIIVEEATYDTTPAAGTWETMRLTSESLSATPQVNQSSEIRADRMVADQFIVSTASEGSMDFELSMGGAFDLLLEGVMYNDWTTNVLKVGTSSTEKSYSLEKEFGDLTANHIFLYSGMRVNQMSLNVQYGEPVTGSFEMVGATVATSSTSAVGGGTLNQATSTDVVNAVDGLSAINIAGTAFTGCIQAITLNINNNFRPEQCIGSTTPGDQIPGTAVITGTVSAYLTDTTVQWYTSQVLNNSAFDIQFTLSDGTNTYDFDLPNCRISGSAPSATGIDTDVMADIEFTALRDATAASSLVITRT